MTDMRVCQWLLFESIRLADWGMWTACWENGDPPVSELRECLRVNQNSSRQPCAGVMLFRAAGVDQAERAVVGGLADDVERAAATRAGLLRAIIGTGGALNQRRLTAVGQKQRRAAAATG